MQMLKQIPPVIHYCWFGGKPLPEQAIKCIESWKKFCPGYEIKRWDESNYDVNACAYTKEAYEAGKWAFVSDYARFDILYQHGGIYFDTDVEMIAPIEDILAQGAFLGIEQGGGPLMVAPGLGMAAPAGSPVYGQMLSDYRDRHFLNPDGTYNQKTVVLYMTEILREYGLQDTEAVQCVAGIYIYPWDYFCPVEYRSGKMTLTANTRTIHHYSASWLTEAERSAHRFAARAADLLGEKWGRRLGNVYSLPRRIGKKVRQKGLWGTVRFAFQKTMGRNGSK